MENLPEVLKSLRNGVHPSKVFFFLFSLETPSTLIGKSSKKLLAEEGKEDRRSA